MFASGTKAELVGTEVETKLFSQQKNYHDKLYVLNDYLEFTVFDMSNLKIESFLDKKEKNLKKEMVTEEINQENTINQAKTEIKEHLKDFPKAFYQNLKKQIYAQKVPLTLCAKQAPDHARPLQLYIKVKSVKVGKSYKDKKGAVLQPFAVKIYGQIKDKEKDTVLTRFYDVASAEYMVGANQITKAIGDVSNEFMKDLSLFLKTKY